MLSASAMLLVLLPDRSYRCDASSGCEVLLVMANICVHDCMCFQGIQTAWQENSLSRCQPKSSQMTYASSALMKKRKQDCRR